MKVLLVGGSGFIGSELSKQLSSQGREFAIADKVDSKLFPDRRQHLDITRYNSTKTEIFRNCNAIVHLAAEHRDDVFPLSKYTDVNVEGTRNVVSWAEQCGIDQIVFTSTVAVYGFAKPNTDETGAINPFNEYGRTKFEAEKILRAWQERDRSSRSLTIVRPTVVFGPGNRGNVFNLLQQIARHRFVMIGDGRNHKSIAYVCNVAAFLQKSLEFGPGVHLFNYVDKPNYDMNDLIRKVRSTLHGKNNVNFRIPVGVGFLLGHIADGIARISGRSLPISSIRVKKFVAETSFTSAAHHVSGFTAPVALNDALEQTLDAEFLNPDPDRVVHYSE